MIRMIAYYATLLSLAWAIALTGLAAAGNSWVLDRVAGGFFIVELFASSRTLANAYADQTIAIFLAVALCYLAVTIPLGRIADRLEKKVAVLR